MQQVLLALEGFSKKSQKTPPGVIRRAEKRLADWRRRARGGDLRYTVLDIVFLR